MSVESTPGNEEALRTGDVLAIEAEKPHSVKISQNFKGDIAFEMKGYGEELTETCERVLEEFMALRTKISEINK